MSASMDDSRLCERGTLSRRQVLGALGAAPLSAWAHVPLGGTCREQCSGDEYREGSRPAAAPGPSTWTWQAGR